MSIKHIQFRGDVAISVGGKHTTLGSWTADKHEATIKAEVRDGFVYLYPQPPIGQPASRRKIPWSSVAYVDEAVEPVKEKGK